MTAPLYFAECAYGRLGIEFQATDRDKNSRVEMIRAIRNRSIDPRKILEITEPCDEFPLGRVVDVTDELVAEAEKPREPPELEDLRQRLLDMHADRKVDLRKHGGLYGWGS